MTFQQQSFVLCEFLQNCIEKILANDGDGENFVRLTLSKEKIRRFKRLLKELQ